MWPNGVGRDGSNNGTAAVLGFGSHGLPFGMAGSDFVEGHSRPRMWMASGYVPSWHFPHLADCPKLMMNVAIWDRFE